MRGVVLVITCALRLFDNERRVRGGPRATATLLRPSANFTRLMNGPAIVDDVDLAFVVSLVAAAR